MDVLYLLIPIAIFLVILAVFIFFWAVKNEQFEDLEGPAHQILYDDPEPGPNDAGQESTEKPDEDQYR